MEEAFVFLLFMGTVFGMVYLYFSTRHKERMALIEKGESVDLFKGTKRRSAIPLYAVILINLGVLGVGIGAGMLVGQLMVLSGMDDDIAMPSMIFICLGLSLLAGFNITRKIDQKYRDDMDL